MNEYFIEEGKRVDLKKLESVKISHEEYSKLHANEIRACHDVFIEYHKGILLIIRKKFPAKGALWPIGGGITRGIKIWESIRKKVKEECGLKINSIKEIGYARTFFKTDPFGHGYGTDSLNLVFFARGSGELRLNKDHKNPKIVRPGEYNEKFRKTLHPYVRDFMDIAVKLIRI